MEANVSLVLWVLIATQMIPARWILRGQDKESPPKNNVLLLSLGLLGLEAAVLGLIGGVVSAWDDPAEMMGAAGFLFVGAGGLVGLLAIAIVRICKDRAAVAALSQQGRCLYWIDVLLKVGLMLLPSLVGARAFMLMDADQAQYSAFSGFVMYSVLAEIALLILRLVLSSIWEKGSVKAAFSDKELERRVKKRVPKTVYQNWTPEQWEEARAELRAQDEGEIGRRYGIWAENPYDPIPEKKPAEQPDAAAEDQQT